MLHLSAELTARVAIRHGAVHQSELICNGIAPISIRRCITAGDLIVHHRQTRPHQTPLSSAVPLSALANNQRSSPDQQRRDSPTASSCAAQTRCVETMSSFDQTASDSRVLLVPGSIVDAISMMNTSSGSPNG